MVVSTMFIFFLLSLLFWCLPEKNNVVFGRNYFLGTLFLVLGIAVVILHLSLGKCCDINLEMWLREAFSDVRKSFF